MSSQGSPQMDAESPLMHRATTHLSLVVGCYNAALHLEKRLLDLVAFLDGTGRDYEVLIVEDGSLDDSLPILRRLEADVSRIHVLRNPSEHGERIFHPKRDPELEREIHHLHRHRHGVLQAQSAGGAGETGERGPVGRRQPPAPGVRVCREQYAGEVCLSSPPHGCGVQCARASPVWADDAGHAERLERLFEERRGQIFQQLYTDGFLFDIEIFIRSQNAWHSRHRSAGAVDIRRRYYDVGQFRYLLTVIPELIHIKMLEIRGAYEHGETLRMPHEGQTGRQHARRIYRKCHHTDFRHIATRIHRRRSR